VLDTDSIDSFHGEYFSGFSQLQKTQILSSFFQCLITILLLFIPDVYALINYVSFVEALFILMSISGLLWLRVKQPEAKRPIKVNLIFPIIFLITCGFLVISSCYVSPVEVGVGCIIIISGEGQRGLEQSRPSSSGDLP
jgi:solute carrier family 7 (L-type amino acid transporter), member 5